MTDATPTIEEMVAFIQSEVDRGEYFIREHPRRKDAPPGADFADEELAMWRAIRNTLSSLSPLIEAARKLKSAPEVGRLGEWINEWHEFQRTLSTFPTPASPWRPIETAPRDGSAMLLYIPYSPELFPPEACADVGFWEADHGCFRFRGDDGADDIQPTAWMPLPGARPERHREEDALPAPPATSDGSK